jgi:hypothetical protein
MILTPRHIDSQVMIPLYKLNGKLSGPHILCGLSDEEKKVFVFPGNPAAVVQSVGRIRGLYTTGSE